MNQVTHAIDYAWCERNVEAGIKRQRRPRYIVSIEPDGGGASSKALQVAPNTYVAESLQGWAVVLYGQPILTYYPDGSVRIWPGRWRTELTRERICRYLPAAELYGGKREWRVGSVKVWEGANESPYLWLPWVAATPLKTSHVTGLARAIRGEAAWANCPILADALLDAGAASDDPAIAFLQGAGANGPNSVVYSLSA